MLRGPDGCCVHCITGGKHVPYRTGPRNASNQSFEVNNPSFWRALHQYGQLVGSGHEEDYVKTEQPCFPI